MAFKYPLQCESGFIESPLSKINFLISLTWVEGGIDVGDPMLKIEKCCERDRAPPTSQKSVNKFRVIWLSMRKDSHCMLLIDDADGMIYGVVAQSGATLTSFVGYSTGRCDSTAVN